MKEKKQNKKVLISVNFFGLKNPPIYRRIFYEKNYFFFLALRLRAAALRLGALAFALLFALLFALAFAINIHLRD